VSGADELLGSAGTAVSGFPGPGSVRVHGEIWGARSEVGFSPGQAVKVLSRDGLVLRVAPVQQEEREA